jgi:hypothetical protein
MSSLTNDLDSVLRRVDPHTAVLLERAVRDSLALAERRNQSPANSDALGYPIGYFEATSGSFAQERLECQPDLPAQTRESW